MKKCLEYLFLFLLVSCNGRGGESVLVETEFFDNKGGWLLDEQFYEQVGSAYLIAHGVGTPVQDATTVVTLPQAGEYHVWARTMNWHAPWDSSFAPGLFKIGADGQLLANSLGNKTRQWDWQYAGSFVAKDKSVALSLHDLSGFDGRCDAILLSKSRHPEFPSERMMRINDAAQEYDFIVVGGGTAGISAAVASARMGLKTLLLEDKPTLGGNASPEIHVITSGRIHDGKYPNLGNVIAEYGNPYKNYDTFLEKLSEESNLTVLVNHRVIGAGKKGDKIENIVAVDYNNNQYISFKASYFADCTGDANLGFLAGARWMMGAETRDEFNESIAPQVNDGRSYGSTVRWYSEKLDSAAVFPVLPWAVQFNDSTCRDVYRGRWNWEVGFKNNQIQEAEKLRDYMFRVIYGNWSYQKNSAKYADKYRMFNLTPSSVSIFLGKRESRRLIGDYIINQNDCYGQWERLDDAAVWCTYPIDQHFPTEEMSAMFPGGEFESAMKHNDMPLGVPKKDLVAGRDYNNPYMIPYRCLYSCNVPNMFMAGRNISGTRIAMCSYRVMATTAMMGEVVGLAAYLCERNKCMPRDIYESYLPQLKSVLDAGVPVKYEFIYNPK